jgi:hypothetical protein
MHLDFLLKLVPYCIVCHKHFSLIQHVLTKENVIQIKLGMSFLLYLRLVPWYHCSTILRPFYSVGNSLQNILKYPLKKKARTSKRTFVL